MRRKQDPTIAMTMFIPGPKTVTNVFTGILFYLPMC